MGISIMTPNTRDPLLVEREKTHGDFRLVARVAQDLKEVIAKYDCKGMPMTQREALDMICTKIARICQQPIEKDHWIDIAGYAKLGSEACE